MKAPDKIYLQTCGDCHGLEIECENCQFQNLAEVTWSEDRIYKKDVEYIRKDALLEWLDGKMTIEGATEGFVGGYDSALKDVINHIRYNTRKKTQRKKLHK